MSLVYEEQKQQQPLTVAEFKYHTTLNQQKTKKEGRAIYDEIEVCVIKHPGDKLSEKVFPANEIWKWVPDSETGERVPFTYAMRFNDQYLKFKSNAVQTQAGVPIAALPFLTPGKRLELKALHIHTAEALAALDGNALKQLGMNGRELKDKAQAFLAEASKGIENAVLLEQIADLKAQIERMGGGAPSAGAEQPEPVNTASPFADMDDDAIKEWLKDATGARPKGNPSRATLISMADELNAEIAAKRAEKVAA